MKPLLVVAALLLVLPAHAEVTIDWVTVDDPGNAADDTGHGAVADVYRISKYEVTNAQYAEFLNAVAATDTYELYLTMMGSVGSPDYGSGITRSGSSGSYTYSVITGREDIPVNYVSFYDALRFANWLHNGQPTGAQDDTTTEDGAYTMITEDYQHNPPIVITRNTGATIFLPSEDEWYKAAYYDTALHTYYNYPAGTDTPTTCAAPGTTANTANCGWLNDDLTEVGSYTGSASPNDTYDQGGNGGEWNEAIIGILSRGLRGGDFVLSSGYFAASNEFQISAGPSVDSSFGGFRVASPPEPEALPSVSPTGVALLGGLVFGIGVMGLAIAARRRRG